MKPKRKFSKSDWIGPATSAFLCVVLAGITYPNFEDLNKLKKEWEELEPLTQQVGKIIVNKAEKSSSFTPDKDPRLLVPFADDGVDFLPLLLEAGRSVGIEIENYQLGSGSFWPAKLRAGSETITVESIPDSYSEEPNPLGNFLRYPIDLQFQCNYLRLQQFLMKLQTLPRFSQVHNIQTTSREQTVEVKMTLEVFSLKPVR